jgi:hypothetical protein
MRIILHSESARELLARELLEKLLNEYELSISTNLVKIEEGSIPHSHPVLTLNTRDLDPDVFLSLFIHEQLHWELLEQEETIISEMAKLFPVVPGRKQGGAQNEQSTWLHLELCRIEFERLVSLIGEDRAKTAFRKGVYPWIRAQVLTNI